MEVYNNRKRKVAPRLEKGKKKDTEVVCMSLGSSKLFTATVQLQEGDSTTDTDMEASETSPKLRNEVKAIYNQLFQKINSQDIVKENDEAGDDDREEYEKQLKEGNVNHERTSRKKRSVSRRSRSKSRKSTGRMRISRSRTRERSRDRDHKRVRHDPTKK